MALYGQQTLKYNKTGKKIVDCWYEHLYINKTNTLNHKSSLIEVLLKFFNSHIANLRFSANFCEAAVSRKAAVSRLC